MSGVSIYTLTVPTIITKMRGTNQSATLTRARTASNVAPGETNTPTMRLTSPISSPCTTSGESAITPSSVKNV